MYPDSMARRAIARSGVQHKASRAAAQYIFSKNWIPDLRGGFAATCPGNESADVIYGGNVIYAQAGMNDRKEPTSSACR
jgi:hypothetical protein